MLLNSFFRCQTYNPYLAPEQLVFSKTTAGEFSYTIPANARHVRIEIAGGNGGKARSGLQFGRYCGGWRKTFANRRKTLYVPPTRKIIRADVPYGAV